MPPRSWFPAAVTYELLTVPVCRKCNKSWEGDSEYMRAVLNVDHRTERNEVVLEIQAKVIRSFARHRQTGPTGDIVKSMREIDLMSPAGVYLGRTGAFDPNMDRLDHVCGQIVRRLYWVHAHTRLPDTHGVGVYVAAAFTPKSQEQYENVARLFAIAQAGGNLSYGDVFSYDHRLERDGLSAWSLNFYGAFPVVAVTIRKTDALTTRQLW